MSNEVELLDALRKFPSSLEKERLRCVGHNISRIGVFPQKLAVDMKSLLISNNALQSLLGIEQFRNLIALSVSNNLIKYMEDILPLKQLTFLRKLSLQGNALANQPFYRDFILSTCPDIEVLDGLKISETMKAESQLNMRQVISKNYGYIQHLVRNSVRNTIFNNFVGKLALHKEFRKVLLQRMRYRSDAHCAALSDGGYIHLNSTATSPHRANIVDFVLHITMTHGCYAFLEENSDDFFHKHIQRLIYRIYGQERGISGSDILKYASSASERVLLMAQQQQEGEFLEMWKAFLTFFPQYGREGLISQNEIKMIGKDLRQRIGAILYVNHYHNRIKSNPSNSDVLKSVQTVGIPNFGNNTVNKHSHQYMDYASSQLGDGKEDIIDRIEIFPLQHSSKIFHDKYEQALLNANPFTGRSKTLKKEQPIRKEAKVNSVAKYTMKNRSSARKDLICSTSGIDALKTIIIEKSRTQVDNLENNFYANTILEEDILPIPPPPTAPLSSSLRLGHSADGVETGAVLLFEDHAVNIAFAKSEQEMKILRDSLDGLKLNRKRVLSSGQNSDRANAAPVKHVDQCSMADLRAIIHKLGNELLTLQREEQEIYILSKSLCFVNKEPRLLFESAEASLSRESTEAFNLLLTGMQKLTIFRDTYQQIHKQNFQFLITFEHNIKRLETRKSELKFQTESIESRIEDLVKSQRAVQSESQALQFKRDSVLQRLSSLLAILHDTKTLKMQSTATKLGRNSVTLQLSDCDKKHILKHYFTYFLKNWFRQKVHKYTLLAPFSALMCSSVMRKPTAASAKFHLVDEYAVSYYNAVSSYRLGRLRRGWSKLVLYSAQYRGRRGRGRPRREGKMRGRDYSRSVISHSTTNFANISRVLLRAVRKWSDFAEQTRRMKSSLLRRIIQSSGSGCRITRDDFHAGIIKRHKLRKGWNMLVRSQKVYMTHVKSRYHLSVLLKIYSIYQSFRRLKLYFYSMREIRRKLSERHNYLVQRRYFSFLLRENNNRMQKERELYAEIQSKFKTKKKQLCFLYWKNILEDRMLADSKVFQRILWKRFRSCCQRTQSNKFDIMRCINHFVTALSMFKMRRGLFRWLMYIKDKLILRRIRFKAGTCFRRSSLERGVLGLKKWTKWSGKSLLLAVASDRVVERRKREKMDMCWTKWRERIMGGKEKVYIALNYNDRVGFYNDRVGRSERYVQWKERAKKRREDIGVRGRAIMYEGEGGGEMGRGEEMSSRAEIVREKERRRNMRKVFEQVRKLIITSMRGKRQALLLVKSEEAEEEKERLLDRGALLERLQKMREEVRQKTINVEAQNFSLAERADLAGRRELIVKDVSLSLSVLGGLRERYAAMLMESEGTLSSSIQRVEQLTGNRGYCEGEEGKKKGEEREGELLQRWALSFLREGEEESRERGEQEGRLLELQGKLARLLLESEGAKKLAAELREEVEREKEGVEGQRRRHGDIVTQIHQSNGRVRESCGRLAAELKEHEKVLESIGEQIGRLRDLIALCQGEEDRLRGVLEETSERRAREIRGQVREEESQRFKDRLFDLL